MAGADLFRRAVLLLVVLVVALHVLRRHLRALAQALGVDHRVLDLALFGQPVVVLALLERLRHVRIGHRAGNRLAELVRREVDDRQLDLLVLALEFVFDLAIADCDPVGQRSAEFLDGHAAANLLLEFIGAQRRIGHLQHLPVARVADEVAVLLEVGKRQNAFAHFLVARADAETFGLGQRGLFLDHLLDDSLVDSELLQQLFVHVAAELAAILLHLLQIRAPETSNGDVPAVHGRHDVVSAGGHPGGSEKTGDIEKDERHHDEEQAPFEPVLMAPHPVEHGHCCKPRLSG